MMNQSLINASDDYIKTLKKIDQDGIKYVLNEEDQTAGIIGNEFAFGNLFIPRSINYESREYLVIIILEGSFKNSRSITSIQFPDDSELYVIGKEAFLESTIQSISIPKHVKQICDGAFSFCEDLEIIDIPKNSELETIGVSAFSHSSIMSILIPPNLSELKEGWCCGVSQLTKITIMPNNRYFMCFNEKFIFGKTDPKSDTYDVLVFACRDIEKAIVPTFVKIIGPYAFHQCAKLEQIEIPENSQLQNIGKYSFSCSSIHSISIPPHLTCISMKAFHLCTKLKKIFIPENSQLEVIERFAFSCSAIEEITIPPSLVEICDRAFHYCHMLKSVFIPKNSNLKTIGSFAFFESSIESLTFPSSVVELKEGWCCKTKSLINVNIEMNEVQNFTKFEDNFILGKTNQKSDIFDVLVFASRSIIIAKIPSFIKHVESYAFSNCMSLKIVEFPPNSELQTIEKETFSESKIQCLIFPSKISELKEGWCNEVPVLEYISITPSDQQNYIYFENDFILGKTNQKSDIFDILVFARRSILCAKIPSFIKHIGPYAFSNCGDLEKVEFLSNSELQTIESNAFSSTPLNSIRIPSNVTKIGDKAFYSCVSLDSVEFEKDSEIQIIEKEAFKLTAIKSISIPPHLTFIGEEAFIMCKYLEKFEIPKNSELRKIDNNALTFSEIHSFWAPPHLTQFGENVFSNCQNLQIFEIDENSELESIDSCLFTDSPLVNIMIPYSHVKRKS